MKIKEHILVKEHKYLTEYLENPRLSIFYGLPKIHKLPKITKDYQRLPGIAKDYQRLPWGYQKITER